MPLPVIEERDPDGIRRDQKKRAKTWITTTANDELR